MINKNINYVSLYSGAGGLDFGFHHLNFNLIFANDFHKDSCKTFSDYYNFDACCSDFNEIKDKIPEADVVIGGPPCQSFSLLGKRDANDKRGNEIINFINLIRKNQPKVFVLENVPGLKSAFHKNIPMLKYLNQFFSKLNYRTLNQKYDCTDIFIPQTRKRQIMIGWKDNLEEPILPDTEDFQRILGFPSDYKNVFVEDALSDLPSPNKNNKKYKYKSLPQNPYQILMRKNSKNIDNHFEFNMSPLDKAYIEHIPPGGNYQNIPDEIASPRVLRIKQTGGRTTTYGRLKKDKYSATINTYFNRPNVGTNYHYNEKRLITPREAMRIQSFPDDFKIHANSIRSICMQIGNAVPPILSIYLASIVKSILR